MSNSGWRHDHIGNAPIVGVVVPTLGTRNHYLLDCLTSIRNAGPCHIELVTATPSAHQHLRESGYVDGISEDQQYGLASAINLGMSRLPRHVTFATWLGDDDLLTEDSLVIAADAFSKHDKAVVVFGSCEYIDEQGRTLLVMRSGRFAPRLLRFGPQLLPQPGSLFLMSAFWALGGLDTTLRGAFDLDLFIRLQRPGNRFVFVPVILGKFRWHRDSLSVHARALITREASSVRVRHLPTWIRKIAICWEPLITWLILQAGVAMNRRLRNITRSK